MPSDKRGQGARDLVWFRFEVTLASAPAGLVTYGVVRLLEPHFAWRTTHGSFVVLLVASLAGLAVDAFAAKLLGVWEMQALIRRLIPRSGNA